MDDVLQVVLQWLLTRWVSLAAVVALVAWTVALYHLLRTERRPYHLIAQVLVIGALMVSSAVIVLVFGFEVRGEAVRVLVNIFVGLQVIGAIATATTPGHRGAR